jgi:CBS domain-containing protein
MQLEIGVTRVIAGDGDQTTRPVLTCPACHHAFPLDEVAVTRRLAEGVKLRRPPASAPWHTELPPASTRIAAAGLWPSRGAAADPPVSAIMTRDVVCVRDDVSADDLTALMLAEGLHGAPVVDGAGALVGFVSITDVLRHRRDRGETGEAGTMHISTRTGGYDLGQGFHPTDLGDTTVRELMTPRPISIDAASPLGVVSVVMASRGVHRLPVVSPSGALVGIISTLDVAGWLAAASSGRSRRFPVHP